MREQNKSKYNHFLEKAARAGVAVVSLPISRLNWFLYSNPQAKLETEPRRGKILGHFRWGFPIFDNGSYECVRM